MENGRNAATGGPATKSIVATTGIVAMVVRHTKTAIEIFGKLYRWGRYLWHNEPKKRDIFLWTIGSADSPADPAEIEEFSKAIEGIGDAQSSFVIRSERLEI